MVISMKYDKKTGSWVSLPEKEARKRIADSYKRKVKKKEKKKEEGEKK
jgi:hypothetical protein